MESPSLMPSDTIKLEPDSELVQMDCVQNSAKEALTDVLPCDNMESQIPAVVKTEQPEVCVDYPEIPPSSEIGSSVSTNKNRQNETHDNINMELVKQEPPDTLSDDTSHGFNNVVEMTTGSFQENTECSGAEATITENGCKVSLNHENCHQISENKSSVIKISNSLFFNKKNQHLQKSGKELNRANMWRKSLDLSVGFAGCFSHGLQTEDMPAVGIDTHLNRCKRTLAEEKSITCDICGASFAQTSNLNRHKKIHTGEKPYKCVICGSSFVQPGNLRIHERIHTGEKHYICDVCGASFGKSGHLKCHKRKHTGEKPYKCDVCDASFAQTSNLSRHKRTHTGERPYKCVMCDASFAQPGNLKIHEKMHTGEKLHTCDICGASFAKSGHLKCHKRKHTGEKPYKCDICDASFAQTSHLDRHKRIHTGEKPHKCDMCGASFAQPGNLRIHERVHTGERHFKCDGCGASFMKARTLWNHKKTQCCRESLPV